MIEANPADYAAYLRADGIAIFLFHGVIERHIDRLRNYGRKHIDRDRFVSILEALNAAGAAVSLEQIIAHSLDGAPLPPRAFAITFDDGFHNNLTVAAPALLAARTPATVYVASDFIDRNLMSWIDRIEWAVQTVLEQNRTVSLRLPWGEAGCADIPEAIRLLDLIRRQVKGDRRLNPETIADLAQEQLGLPRTIHGDGPLDRKMTWDELRALASQPLITVGGHSHTHAILAYLDPPALRAEILTSKRLLAERAGVDVRHYSYPEGLAHCYSDAVIAALRAHGVLCCPTAEPGVNGLRPDLFRLKRIPVI